MTTATKARSLNQRAVEATSRLRDALELEDVKVLSAAVAEAAADEAISNPRFATRVQALYQELLSLQKTRPVTRDKDKPVLVPLIPISGDSHNVIDPYAPLSAYLLLEYYGP